MRKRDLPPAADHKALAHIVSSAPIELIVIVVGDRCGARPLETIRVVQHMRPGIRNGVKRFTKRMPVPDSLRQAGHHPVVIRMRNAIDRGYFLIAISGGTSS